MLIRFSSNATESITMFGNDATVLIKMLGASGAIPGAIGAEEIPAALTGLRQQLQIHESAKPSVPEVTEDELEEGYEPPIALAVRAAPLLDILERASAAKVPVMWEEDSAYLP